MNSEVVTATKSKDKGLSANCPKKFHGSPSSIILHKQKFGHTNATEETETTKLFTCNSLKCSFASNSTYSRRV